jgi:hypothetical protein
VILVERVVLNALAGIAALAPDICAFGDPFGIVFGEADPPSRLSSQQNFPKNFLPYALMA